MTVALTSRGGARTLQQRLEWAAQAGALGELCKQAIWAAEEAQGQAAIETWDFIAKSRAKCAWRYAESAREGVLFPRSVAAHEGGFSLVD